MTQNNVTRAFRHSGIAVAICLLAILGAAAPPRMAQPPGVTIKNFGKVSDQFYRGSQPNEAEVAQLKKLGVKTVIDLRKDSVPEEARWVKASGMQYFNIPLKASVAATEEQTSYFLNIVNNSANWPVYVHCKGGRHRTGALTAVYRITRDGWTADQAYEEMKEYDFNDSLFGGPVAQKKYVYAFYERYRAQPANAQK
jgi:protein tyrosine/serine phosphatase